MYTHTMNLQYLLKLKHNQIYSTSLASCPCRNRRPREVESEPDNEKTFKVDQPCPLLLSQIQKISPSTPPWTADPAGLHSARQCSHHHPHQIGGPPSWEQGTEQWQHCHPQHTSERHCFHSAETEKDKGTTNQQLSMYAGHDISPSN